MKTGVVTDLKLLFNTQINFTLNAKTFQGNPVIIKFFYQ